MPKFTKEELNNTRLDGYTDQEIASYLAKDDDEIQNALEEGYSLDEIADYFSKGLPEKQVAEKKEDPSTAKVVAGLAADIAVAEGAKYGGAAAGAYLGTLGGPFAPLTVPAGTAAGYVSGAIGGGWTGSVLAQKIEGADSIDYGRATIDTMINLIPFAKVGKGGTKLAKISGMAAKRPIAAGMAIGGIATPAYMASEELQDKKDYTLEDYLGRTGSSMALGAGLGVAGKVVNKGLLKIRNKTPDEVNKLIEAGDPDTIRLVDYLTANIDPQDTKLLPSNFTNVSDYIKNATRATVSSLAPSRIVGNDVTNFTKGAKSSVEAVEGTAANIGKQIDSYLEKNPQYRDDAIAFLDGESRPDLPPDLLEKLTFGRSKIAQEQQRMIDLHNSGDKLLPNNRAEIIEESLNKENYLRRAYEFYENPNYKPSKEKYDALKLRLTTGLTEPMKEDRIRKFISDYKPTNEEIEAIRRFHGVPPGGSGKSNAAYQKDLKASYTPSQDRIAQFKKKLDNEKLTDAEANAYLAELQLKMKGNPVDFANYMKGPGTPDVFKQRKVVSKELEDFLGLIEDPGRKTGITMSVLNRINEYSEADAKIARALLDSGAAVRASDPKFTQGLQPLNLKLGRPVVEGEELFVDPNVQTALNKLYAGKFDEVSNSVVTRTINDIFQTAVSGLKSAKVLGNLPSYLIQIPSNLAIIASGGMNPVRGLDTAIKMSLGTLSGTKIGGLPVIKKFANQAPPLTLQEFEDRKRRQMITGNVAFEDLKAGLQGKRIGRAFEKVVDVPGKIYSIPDNVGRNIVYENNMNALRISMPTATEEQIKDMAARWTTGTYPNYESISPEIKALSRFGVMPQFVTYTLEFARSQIEQVKLLKAMADGTFTSKLGSEFKDIPVNQTAMKKEAAKRLVAVVSSYAAASYGLNQFNRKSLTEEQERAFRDTVAADFERDKPLFIKKNDDNSYTVVNTAYYLPQTILANPIMSILRGENAEESTSNILGILGSELIGKGSFAAQEFSSIASGRDFETGELISNDPDTIDNVADRLENFGKGFIPSSVTAIQRKDKTLEEKLTRQAGLRVEKRDNAEGFGFKANGINEAINNIKATMSGRQYALKSGKISPQEYEAAIAQEQSNYAGNMDKMINHVKNLKTLGETDETIIPMLQKARFSTSDILNLLDGKNVPFDPVRRKTTTEMLDEITGASNAETEKNIREYIKQDKVTGEKILNAYKERRKAEGIVLSPKERLVAGLPSIEKIERVFPEIQSSNNPDAAIRRLVKKKILNESDVEAIKIRQRSN